MEFGKAAAQIFFLERASIVRAQGASENKKFAAKPTKPDSIFSNTFGITFHQNFAWSKISAKPILITFNKGDNYDEICTQSTPSHFTDMRSTIMQRSPFCRSSYRTTARKATRRTRFSWIPSY